MAVAACSGVVVVVVPIVVVVAIVLVVASGSSSPPDRNENSSSWSEHDPYENRDIANGADAAGPLSGDALGFQSGGAVFLLALAFWGSHAGCMIGTLIGPPHPVGGAQPSTL